VQYLDKIKKLLPSKDLTSVVLGGHEYVTAPIADLPFLFPQATLAPGQSPAAPVYTPRSTGLSNP
jgi:hypothetical protein